ncbi:GDSL-type esterase/lipase family protein [Bacteroidota bacterium]
MRNMPGVPILFIFLFLGIEIHGGFLPDSVLYLNNPNYQLELGKYDIYKTKQADIVMLGNSLTHGVNWDELIGRSNIVERAIPSDVTEGILNRMNYVIKLKPKICFILAGLNDIYNWKPVEQIFENYVKVINRLRLRNIIPVIQSTLYAGRDWPQSADRNKIVSQLNNYLRNYAEENKLDFIDLNIKMSKSNFLRSDLTHDGVHLNGKGFKIWGKEVEKVLTKHGL